MKKVVKKKNMFNILTIILCIGWVFSFFGSYFTINTRNESYERLYLNMINTAACFNSQLNAGDGDNNGEALFSDAKTAVITAFNSFKECTAWEIVGFGIGGGGVTFAGKDYSLQIAMQNKFVQWPDGTNLVELGRKQIQDFIAGDIMTGTLFYYYEDGKRYRDIEGEADITLENDVMDIDYKNHFHVDEYISHEYRTMLYIVNEKSIAKENFFKINRNTYTNKIESYSASVAFNCAIACKDYSDNLKLEMGNSITDKPVFTELEFNMLIGTDGNIQMLNIKETYSFVFVSFGVKVTTYSDITYKFLSLNKEPTTIERFDMQNAILD